MSVQDQAGTSNAAREYRDFSLELRNLSAQDDSYEVALLPSPEFGEPPAARVPLNAPELTDALEDLEDKRIDQADLIRLGQGLTERLLPAGAVHDHFVEAVKAAGQDRGVRLRLLIREPRLAQLPWEFAYLQLREGQPDRSRFLVLDPQVSLVRHVPLDQPQPSLQPHDPAELDMVAAFASPIGLPVLKLRREEKVIESALGAVTVDGVRVVLKAFLESATLPELTTVLQQKADIFHFAGHGGFLENQVDPETGRAIDGGCIVILRDKDTTEPYYLSASDLAVLLQAAGARIAVLGACESGRQDAQSPWTGIAPALIGRGLPAVVGMQYRIQDAAAIAFSTGLYTALAAGLSMDEAVYAGRLAMLNQSGPDDVEWGVPMLFLRAGDGVVFPHLAERPSSTRDQLRTVIRQSVMLNKAGASVIGLDINNLDASVGRLSQALQAVGLIDQRIDTNEGNTIGIRLGENTESSDARRT